MQASPKEGAGRPLYSTAPILQPGAARAGTPLWQTLPRRRVFLAAAGLSYLYGAYYLRRALPGLPPEAAGRVFWPVFAVLFLAGVSAFARALGRPERAGARFWAACWLVQSAALTIWNPHAGDWRGVQLLAWHLTAVYWVLARTGMQAAGQANAMVVLDGVAGLITLPFGQFFLRIRVVFGAACAGLRGWRRRAGLSGSARRRAAELALGVLLAVGLVAVAGGELRRADANFAALLDRWGLLLRWPASAVWDDLLGELFWLVAGLPVGAWLFGLVGGALRRQSPPVTERTAYAVLGAAPRLPALTARIAVGALCAVYALFFGVQLVEFAAAAGLPLAPRMAAGFAVEGFWSLCRVLLLNFAVLAALHFLGARPADAPGPQRRLLAVFGAFGLGFGLLAAAKLGVYIALYGLTPRRVLSAWVIAVLLLGCVLAGVRLFRRIPAARVLLAVFALSFSLLCCADIEGLCLRDHLHRLSTGAAEQVDWSLVRQCVYADAARLGPATAEALRGLPLSEADAAQLAGEDWLYGCAAMR